VNWIVRLDALKVAVVVKGVRSGTDLITIGKTSTDDRVGVEVEAAGFTSMVHHEDFQVPMGSHDYGSPQSSQRFTETTSLGFAVQVEIPQTGVPMPYSAARNLALQSVCTFSRLHLGRLYIATNITGRRKEVGKRKGFEGEGQGPAGGPLREN
jgi:hypothetical protein